ncbi:hypothetical protein V6N13_008042 [Hibiscus sabdariffa]|uniref:RRM domain-containing protein n=1 Tax=Hibiscus sabdariffa TaxID=183260 RepID=A0ABR2EC35_9ROSI
MFHWNSKEKAKEVTINMEVKEAISKVKAKEAATNMEEKEAISKDEVQVEKTKAEMKCQEVYTMFVKNITLAMRWKGLWHTFARHGNVVDSFTARKPSRGGKKFGFMHFEKKLDVVRVTESLNGFILYGFRLVVKMARYEGRRGGGSHHRKSIGQSNQVKVKSKSRHCEDEQAKFPHHGVRPVEIGFARGSLNIPKSMEVK